MKKDKIVLVGCGYMAREYAKVLLELNLSFTAVGRGKKNAEIFKTEFPHVEVHTGGLDHYLAEHASPEFAVVSVGIAELTETTILLIKQGVKKILTEKPAALNLADLEEIRNLSEKKSSQVFIAYNRRFYRSAEIARKMIEEDGGISSCHFEFTEWVHQWDITKYAEETSRKLILSNSTHVIDLVFHLCGRPAQMHPLVSGLNEISWHPSGSCFTGSGITEKYIPFTYHSDWNAPGRWSIEILTNKNRLYFKPMERLMVQKKGSVTLSEIPDDYSADIKFKPGLLNMLASFFNTENDTTLCSLNEHLLNFPHYEKIGGY